LKAACQFCNGQFRNRANSQGRSGGTWVARVGSVPKKQQIKLSPGRSGRRVRWTFEVSADVDAADRARVKQPAKKAAKERKTAKPNAKRANRSAPPQVHEALPAPTPPMTDATLPSAAPGAAVPPAVEATSDVVTAPVLSTTPRWQPTRGQMGALSAVAVLVVALVATPQRQSPADTTRAPEPPQRREGVSVPARSSLSTAPSATTTPTSSGTATSAPAAPPTVKARGPSELPKKSPAQNVPNRTAGITTPPTPAPVAVKASAPRPTTSTTQPAVEEPGPMSSASTASLDLATITGCLEISTDGTEFRLADTEGADAPKSRSWRTGFLRRRTAPVNLVGVTDPVALKKRVGARVAATGQLTDRELRISSLRVLGTSCN
jgi:hypothetical protein